jgi:hypothetical protein
MAVSTTSTVSRGFERESSAERCRRIEFAGCAAATLVRVVEEFCGSIDASDTDAELVPSPSDPPAAAAAAASASLAARRAACRRRWGNNSVLGGVGVDVEAADGASSPCDVEMAVAAVVGDVATYFCDETSRVEALNLSRRPLDRK